MNQSKRRFTSGRSTRIFLGTKQNRPILGWPIRDSVGTDSKATIRHARLLVSKELPSNTLSGAHPFKRPGRSLALFRCLLYNLTIWPKGKISGNAGRLHERVIIFVPTPLLPRHLPQPAWYRLYCTSTHSICVTNRVSTNFMGQPELAHQVCQNCKSRKRKCSKELPKCELCTKYVKVRNVGMETDQIIKVTTPM